VKWTESASSAALAVARPTRRSSRAPPGIHADLDEDDHNDDDADLWSLPAGADAADRFHHHSAGQQQEQRCLPERGNILKLAVAIGVRCVRAACRPSARPRASGSRDEIHAGVERVGNKGKAADHQAEHQLHRGQHQAGDQRD
jgi:hypothetical protein